MKPVNEWRMIVRLYVTRGATIAELAKRFAVTDRQIRNYLGPLFRTGKVYKTLGHPPKWKIL